MRKRALIFVLAILSLASTPRGMAPLPAQYLQGPTFHAPDGWFKIDGPRGWEWFEMRAFDGDADPRWPDAVHQTVAWMAQHPKTFDNVVVMETYTLSGKEIDDEYMEAFESQTRGAMDRDESLTDFSIQPLSVPTEKSAHYSYTVKKKGKALYRHGYISGSEHKVFVFTSSETPAEPRWLTRMAVSLRWLNHP
jgi:hypothetical protein